MSEDAIAYVYVEGANQSLEQYHSRRALEWSISVPYWTGLALLFYFVWTERVSQGLLLAVGLTLVLGAYGAFLRTLQASQRRDLAITFAHRREAVRRAVALEMTAAGAEAKRELLDEEARKRWKRLGIQPRKAASWYRFFMPPMLVAFVLSAAITFFPPRHGNDDSAELKAQLTHLRERLDAHLAGQAKDLDATRPDPSTIKSIKP